MSVGWKGHLHSSPQNGQGRRPRTVLVDEPPPDTAVQALLDYYRPVHGRLVERLTQLRGQSASLIQTELTVVGLALVVLVILAPGVGGTLGFVAALGVVSSFTVSVLFQRKLHATRSINEMPSDDDVYQVQHVSDAATIRLNELTALRGRIEEMRKRHEEHVRLYQSAFRWFAVGIATFGLAAFAWILTEVKP